jgi:hypothetical protein
VGWFSNSKFAFCRGIASHAWHFPPEFSYEGKQLALTLRCDHCGARRKDRVSAATGAVDSRSYTYADGYRLDLQGDKRPEKAALRKDGIALLLDEAKHAPRSNVRKPPRSNVRKLKMRVA